ncbi:MAG: tetratricopeptide repeat protein [Verrucomicrobia bacterium]|nr:tetratricopeptide repeat protein [Verrucomicrobiota bacterium]
MRNGLAAFCALCAFLGFSALVLRGQGPEEKYVGIYNLIQEGDAWRAKRQPRAAADAYAKAYAILKEYPALHPGWNENVVGYRMQYLTRQLETLAPHLLATNSPGVALPPAPPEGPQPAPASIIPTPPPPPPTLPEPGPAPSPPADTVKALSDEIARLTRMNANLEDRLKEALSVQPAAVDARELAKAEDRIRQLQQELDLLRVSLEQEKARAVPAAPPAVPATPPPAAVDPALAEQERVLIADLKERLVRQNALLQTLRQENAGLKTQLTLATASVAVATSPSAVLSAGVGAPQDLDVARAIIAALQATNVALRTEQILLQNRIRDLSRSEADLRSDKVNELTAQRDELRGKLAVALRELERTKSRPAARGTDDLATRLESVLAKLDVYEAKAVPYTPEELVLFQRRATNAPAAVANAEKITVADLPPNTGTLIAKAMQASREHRFDEAEHLLLEVLSTNQNHVFTLDNLAAVQLKQERLEQAEKTLQHALKLEPQNPHTLFLLGHLRFKQAQYDPALDALSLSAKLNPDDPWTQYFLAQTLIQKGARTAAETALRKALQLKPEWPEAHHSLALVYATQQPPFRELAQWHYSKALAQGHSPDSELRRLIGNNPAPAPTP